MTEVSGSLRRKEVEMVVKGYSSRGQFHTSRRPGSGMEERLINVSHLAFSFFIIIRSQKHRRVDWTER